MEPSPSEEEGEITKALTSLEQRLAAVSQWLAPAGRHRVMGDNERRCLALMEKVLSDIAADLKSYPFASHDYFSSGRESPILHWLSRLDSLVAGILRSTDPPGHTLLPSALVCCRRRNQDWYWRHSIGEVLWRTEHPRDWYRHMLSASTKDIIDELPHQASDQPLIGIDRPMKKLLRWLLPTRNKLSVMSVVGLVGIGKTTLAVELQNQLNKRQSSGGHDCFQFNIMARMSSRKEDRTKLLLEDILSKISDPAAPAPSSMDEDDLVRHVSERLQDKRYFICIDDIREDSDWDKIEGAFPDNNRGSRVLITTSVVSTAWAFCSYSEGLMHEMKPLNQEDSENLLLTRAFGSLDCGLQLQDNNMKRFVDKILMRANGLPLFINAMAQSGWLKEQFQRLQRGEEAEEKIEIYDKEQFQLLQREQFQQSLHSAYDGLHEEWKHWKVLLLYVSMLPYEHTFDKDRFLRRLWAWVYWRYIDTKFLFFRINTELEEFFSVLVDRNIITRVATTCKSDPDEDESSQWHVNHFLHQFLVSKAAEIGFGFTSDTLHCLATTERGSKTRRIPRRLALHRPDQRIPSLLETLDLFATRHLAVSGAVSGIPLEKFDNLFVLDLEGWENLTDEDLLKVCTSRMIFLCYLNISKTPVRKLPQEIKNLWNLKVLDVSYTQISELPLEVFKLKELEILDTRGTQIRQLPKEIAGLSDSLSVLFLGEGGTINTVETARSVPCDVRHLLQLQALATIDLSDQPASFVKALGDLKYLQVLAITWSFHQSQDQDYREALLSSIRNWCELESLTIHCGLGCSMEFLGSLSKPPEELKKFKVTAGRFASVPKWISKLEYLTFVQITICKQGREDLEILGGLPKLQCLILGLDFIPGEAIMVGNDGFKELQRFTVDCPMPWLTFSTGAMPKLTYLQLKKLSAIPAKPSAVPSGLGSLRRLTEVVLSYNMRYADSPSIKMTVEAVKEQVATHWNNCIDLFINGIEYCDFQSVDEVLEEDAVATQSGTEAESEFGVQAVGKELVGAAATQISSTCEVEEIQSEP